VAPLQPKVDIFLPFWWIAKHPPQGVWDSDELHFSSPSFLNSCTKYEVDEFSLSLDETVCLDPEARVVGYISAVDQKDRDPFKLVPGKFKKYLNIMGTEAAEALPLHRLYDCKIDLKEGETAPWGPIYPLLETELQTLREWL